MASLTSVPLSWGESNAGRSPGAKVRGMCHHHDTDTNTAQHPLPPLGSWKAETQPLPETVWVGG